MSLKTRKYPLAYLVVILAAALADSAWAIYTDDSAVPSGKTVAGKTVNWDLPIDKGTCVTGIEGKQSNWKIDQDVSKPSRPDCLTVTFDPPITTQASCINPNNNAQGSSHYWASSCIAADGTAISLNGVDRTGAMCDQTILAQKKTPQGWECIDSSYTTIQATSNNLPANIVLNQLWYDPQTNKLQIYNGSAWTDNGTPVATVKPQNPKKGTYFFDGSIQELLVSTGNNGPTDTPWLKASCTGASYAWDGNLAKCVDLSKTQATCSGVGATGGNTTLTWTSKSLANACTGSWIYLGANNDGKPGFCYTTVNVTTLYKTQDACPTWAAGYSWGSNKCTYAYGIKGYPNANLVKKDGTGNFLVDPATKQVDLSNWSQGQCLFNGASWSTGITKLEVNRTLNTTPVSSEVANVTAARPGCLECHNSISDYNAFAERWRDSYLLTGHKNILRKVTLGQDWGGPDGNKYTVTADGQTLDFGNATASGKSLWYLWGDWMTSATDSLGTIVDSNNDGHPSLNGKGAPYTCAACHTTGWSNPDPASGLCTDSTKLTSGDCIAAGYNWVPSTGVQAGICFNDNTMSQSDAKLTTSLSCIAAGKLWSTSIGIQGASYTAPEPHASFDNYMNPASAGEYNTSGITGNWDRDGIMCSRCHASAFPVVTITPINSSNTCKSPASWSNNVCTFSTANDCTSSGGFWSGTANTCSLSFTNPDCIAAGGKWNSNNTCSLTDIHNITPSPTGDDVRIVNADGTVDETFTSLGPQHINRICLGCHLSPAKKQRPPPEAPPSLVGNGAYVPMTDLELGNIAVWTTYGRDFSRYSVGNEFLNSPHARLTGGKIYPNALGKYDLTKDGQYNSAFKRYICRSSTGRNSGNVLSTVITNGKPGGINSKQDCNIANGKSGTDVDKDWGYWQAETQGSCVTCHAVHQSVVEEVGAEEPFNRECPDCHKDKLLININHPRGSGTPLADMSDPPAACETCHMPRADDFKGNEKFPSHLFRINTDAAYSTFPTKDEFEAAGVCSDGLSQTRTACTPGTCSVAAKTTISECEAAYGTWTRSDANNTWTGTAIANSAPETYFATVNGSVTAQTYQGAVWNDLDMTCGQCHGGSAGRAATKNRAPYMTKQVLALYAKGMHHNVRPTASFVQSLTGLTVTLTDTSTDDSVAFPPKAVTIKWGDGTSSQGDAGTTFTHTYAKARKYRIVYVITDRKGLKKRKVIRVKATNS